MKILKTKFKGLFILKSKVFFDDRGFFRETFRKKILNKNLIFGCCSNSKKNVLRGLHLQNKNAQGKFITVIKGEVFDVAVDLRKNSSTFGKYFSINLSERNGKSIFIPAGFAHGFVGLKKENIIYYFCSFFNISCSIKSFTSFIYCRFFYFVHFHEVLFRELFRIIN